MQEITQASFEEEVLRANGVVLVDFNAEWCGPCQAMRVTLESLADKVAAGKTKMPFEIMSVNIDDEPELAEKYEVMSIPCLVVFRGGEEMARATGVKSEKFVRKMAEKASG